MLQINLQSLVPLKESDLTFQCLPDCKTYSLKEFPEFVFRYQSWFSERSKILADLEPETRDKHEEIIALYKDTFTQTRLELEKYAAEMKEETRQL